MVFSSVVFLFYFLPIVLGVYFLFSLPSFLKKKNISIPGSNFILLVFSMLFYAWGEKLLLLIMLTSVLIDYLCGLIIAGRLDLRNKKEVEILTPGASRSGMQKAAMFSSVVTNLTILGIFKYFNFFIDSYNMAFAAVGLSTWQIDNVLQIALPMGISFYTFQSMSYTIDVYRGKVAATRNLLDFACFVTMFPQLVAGPIVRYSHVAEQLRKRQISIDDFAYGIRRFIIGLGKKVLVADYLAIYVDEVFAMPGAELTTGLAWVGAIGFAAQVYFDFSGYSDMAIGLGRMFGFHFLENFNYPNISRSLKEYWTRWHISLGSWFRDYLFIPLGGSRCSEGRVYLNLLTVFVLCGLWHGASWTFVAWALSHGFFLIIERQGFNKFLEKLWSPLQNLYFLVVSISIKTVFRAETFEGALDMLKAMAGFARGDGIARNVLMYFNWEFIIIFSVAIIGNTPIVPALSKFISAGIEKFPSAQRPRLIIAWELIKNMVYLLVLVASILVITSVKFKPFLYFKF